jgi:hypothetical protein
MLDRYQDRLWEDIKKREERKGDRIWWVVGEIDISFICCGVVGIKK